MIYASKYATKRPPFYIGHRRRESKLHAALTLAGIIVAGVSVCLVGACAAMVGA